MEITGHYSDFRTSTKYPRSASNTCKQLHTVRTFPRRRLRVTLLPRHRVSWVLFNVDKPRWLRQDLWVFFCSKGIGDFVVILVHFTAGLFRFFKYIVVVSDRFINLLILFYRTQKKREGIIKRKSEGTNKHMKGFTSKWLKKWH